MRILNVLMCSMQPCRALRTERKMRYYNVKIFVYKLCTITGIISKRCLARFNIILSSTIFVRIKLKNHYIRIDRKRGIHVAPSKVIA